MVRNGNTITAGGTTCAASMPNRVRDPPARYLAITYAPMLPTTRLIDTVTMPTRALRPAAAKMPDSSTAFQFSIVGAKATRNGSDIWAGVLKLASATQPMGNSTKTNAAVRTAIRTVSSPRGRIIG